MSDSPTTTRGFALSSAESSLTAAGNAPDEKAGTTAPADGDTPSSGPGRVCLDAAAAQEGGQEARAAAINMVPSESGSIHVTQFATQNSFGGLG